MYIHDTHIYTNIRKYRARKSFNVEELSVPRGIPPKGRDCKYIQSALLKLSKRDKNTTW